MRSTHVSAASTPQYQRTTACQQTFPGTNWTCWTPSDKLHLSDRTNRRPSPASSSSSPPPTSSDRSSEPSLASSSATSFPSSSSCFSPCTTKFGNPNDRSEFVRRVFLARTWRK
ncbi:hypothetical protein SprV_0802528500 [Sparganum proliferum]